MEKKQVNWKIIGNRLSNLINESEYKTQECFATYIPGKSTDGCMSKNTINRYCTGKNPIPYSQALIMANLLKCQVSYLQDDNEKYANYEDSLREKVNKKVKSNENYTHFLSDIGIYVENLPYYLSYKTLPDLLKGFYNDDKYKDILEDENMDIEIDFFKIKINNKNYIVTNYQLSRIKTHIELMIKNTYEDFCELFNEQNKIYKNVENLFITDDEELD